MGAFYAGTEVLTRQNPVITGSFVGPEICIGCLSGNQVIQNQVPSLIGCLPPT